MENEEKEHITLPVCPHCKTEMQPREFIGYYDQFFYWECRCEKIPNSEEHHGCYA